MRKSRLIFALIIAFCTTSFPVEQAKANPIAAPACRDVPSCIFIGTVVIGGIVYYVIKNTVTGVVHRVPARSMPPAHRSHQGEENPPIGRVIQYGLISKKECKQKAREAEQRYGGRWIDISPGTGISRENEDGTFTQLYYCSIRREG